MKEKIATNDAPQAIGPYSQAIKANGMVFCSGQVALDPANQQFVGGDVAAQTERVMKNLAGVLKAAGTGFDKVVRTTVFLTTMDHFAAMNEVYAKHFPAPCPARATVQVAALPKGAAVEIEAVAFGKK